MSEVSGARRFRYMPSRSKDFRFCAASRLRGAFGRLVPGSSASMQSAHLSRLTRFLGRWLGQCRDQYSALAQHPPRTILGLARDQVEDHVDVAHHVLEALLLVVEDLIGTQIASECDVLLRRGCNDLGAPGLGKLHGEVTDAARPTVDQHALALLESAIAEKALPGGEPGERHRRGCRVIQ